MNFFFAFLVSFLPRRYWRGASGLGIFFSGLVQLGLSLAGLISVYTQFSQNASDDIADATLEQATRVGGDGKVHIGGAMAMNALTPIGFLAASGTGRIFAYLVFSAIIRLLGFATDHPCGDPLLSVVDEVIWDGIYYVKRTTRSAAQAVRSRWRDRSESEDSNPDD